MQWNKTIDELPEECRPVLCKYNDTDGECLGLLTMSGDDWVLDATESELYGSTAHEKVSIIPHEWSYID